MNTLILNSSNVTAQTNTFQFNFIGSGYEVKPGSKIAISSITIPYSWFNVTTNNRLIILWHTGVEYTVTFDPGFYSATDLNGFLEQYFIAQRMYLIDASGNYVYYMKILYNVVYYSVQVLLYPIPIALPSGLSEPVGGFLGGFPTPDPISPRFNIPLTASIGSIIGYLGQSPGVYYGNGGTSSLSLLSNTIPVGSQVNSIIVRATICDNPVVNPTDILDSFPITSSFGENINYVPNTTKWIKAKPGRYSNLIVSFFDQNLNALPIRDSNLLITLLLE